MTTFVSSAGATLPRMVESGRLWVADQLPPEGKSNLTLVKITADEKDDANRLAAKWLHKMGLDAPREREMRARALYGAVHERTPVVLVVEQAHLLKARTLIGLRPVAERLAPLILVGDVLAIGARVRTNQSFMLRAGFCVNALQVWSNHA